MKNIKRISSLKLLIVLCFAMAGCAKEDEPQKEYVLFSATGDIQAELNVFRVILGEQVNITPGAVGGRREINWEAIPDNLLNTRIPEDFFNPVGPGEPEGLQRGLVYSTVGEFRVSKNNFAEVNPAAASQFAAFSGTKSFSNISSNLWDVEFQVAGQNVAAKVNGFGIVFSDVDLPDKTFLEFYNNDKLLGKFFVPPHDANSNYSFLGVHFNTPRITRVRVGHEGKLADGKEDISNGGPEDLIVMDDFLYSEPVKK